MQSPIPFTEALSSLRSKGLLPTSLSSEQLAKLPAEIRERAMFSARVTNANFLRQIQDDVSGIISPEGLKPGEYLNPATVRLRLKESLKKISYEPDPDKRGTIQDLSSDRRLDLIIDTQTKMAAGYGNWMQEQNTAVLDQWPAQELFRAEARRQERAWPSRWAAAGGQFYGGGRMIALKNAPIWENISTFGLPYPPFDFNSGMGVVDVDRDEAIALGLIDRDTQIQPQTRGFNDGMQASGNDLAKNLRDQLLTDLGKKAAYKDGSIQLES